LSGALLDGLHCCLCNSRILSFSPALQAAASEALAEVNGVPITGVEVEKAIGAQLAKLEEQIYALKRQKLEALIDQKLLAAEAAKRGMPVAVLLDAEVTGKVGLVTEQEIESFYQANKARLQGEEAQIREQVRAGTPAFFINGRMVSGAQPLESFARLIEDELARAR